MAISHPDNVTGLTGSRYVRTIFTLVIVAAICLSGVPSTISLIADNGIRIGSADDSKDTGDFVDGNAAISVLTWIMFPFTFFAYAVMIIMADSEKVFCVAGLPCVTASVLYHVMF